MPTPILMPALSPTMEEGTLAKWTAKEGDKIASGDVIAEIETDKATMEVEAVDEGVLGKILVAEGSEGVKVNAPIAWLLEDGESAADIPEDGAAAATNGASDAAGKEAQASSGDAPASSGDTSKAASNAPTPEPADAPKPTTRNGGRVFASPLARRLAAQKGLDLSAIKGSGPNGRIVKRDVEGARADAPETRPAAGPAEAPKAAPPTAPAGEGVPTVAELGLEDGTYTVQKLDGMRKTIAKRLTQSFRDVPHFPLNVDCEVDALLKLRKQLNGTAPLDERGYRLSVNDFLIRASALALKKVPEANASFAADGIVLHEHAHVAVAVAIEGGLITPVVFKAETKGLQAISAEVKDLATRARDRKLQPHEYQGGTFSISNLGMFGIKSFGSIVNQPQGMILSVGAGEKRPVVKDGALAVATVMTVTLTCDHRVVDGAVGARWLQVFKRFVEDPVTMLL